MFMMYHLIRVSFQSTCDSVVTKVKCFYGDALSDGKNKGEFALVGIMVYLFNSVAFKRPEHLFHWHLFLSVWPSIKVPLKKFFYC